jgi:hypothetical protein
LSLVGVVLQSAYRLRRHLWLEWPLSRWLGFLLLAGGTAVLIHYWPQFWLAIPPGALFLGYAALMTWAARRQHVHFEAAPEPEGLLHDAGDALGKEELVPVQASGWFTVEGKDQFFMDIEADFETVGTREHIILGRVHPSRFLLLGQWPKWEQGWWYLFFRPEMIRAVEIGYLHFGPHPQAALRVSYTLNEESEETIYLSSDDASMLRQVWDDLLLDTPASVTVPAGMQL